MKVRSDRGISRAFVLVLISLFMITALLVVLSGTRAYERSAETARVNADRRVSMNYALNTVRMGSFDGISVENRDGIDVLTVVSDFSDEYVTYLYAYDGYLMSLFTAREYDFYPEDGEKVTPMQSFRAYWEQDGLLCFEMTDEDGVVSVMHAAVGA